MMKMEFHFTFCLLLLAAVAPLVYNKPDNIKRNDDNHKDVSGIGLKEFKEMLMKNKKREIAREMKRKDSEYSDLKEFKEMLMKSKKREIAREMKRDPPYSVKDEETRYDGDGDFDRGKRRGIRRKHFRDSNSVKDEETRDDPDDYDRGKRREIRRKHFRDSEKKSEARLSRRG